MHELLEELHVLVVQHHKSINKQTNLLESTFNMDRDLHRLGPKSRREAKCVRANGIINLVAVRATDAQLRATRMYSMVSMASIRISEYFKNTSPVSSLRNTPKYWNVITDVIVPVRFYY